MKSSFSSNGANCISVEQASGIIYISEDLLGELNLSSPSDGYQEIKTSTENFAAFIKGVKAGEFDHFVEG